MPAFGPISRSDLIRALRAAGCSGPHAGGKHSFMRRGTFTLTLPNAHRGDIGKNLLANLLRQARMSREEWEAL